MNFLLGFATLLSLVVAIRGGIQIEEDNGILQDYVIIYFVERSFSHGSYNKKIVYWSSFPIT